MIIGYARVSTPEQRLHLQTDALTNAGCERIYQDIVSGSQANKEQLHEALKFLRAGDTFVVWRLDRLGRSLKQLLELMNEFENKGVAFRSLVEAIDTSTPTGKFFFHITGAFAELERNLIRERTKAGLEAAKARGRLGGRPRAIDDETFQMAMNLHKQNEATVAQICNQLGIKRRTFYRYLKAHQAQQAAKSNQT